MLKFFSRQERTRNLILVVFAIIMAVSLVIFYAPGRNSASATPATNTEVLARVGSDDVTVGDLQLIKDSYMQMFGGQISLAQLGGDKRFLDGLIRDRVIAQEAARLGLAASDAEVADKIRKQFKDASGKFVGFDRYKESVVSRYGSIERFERQIRDQVAAEKLQAFVTAGVRVSETEVQDDYKRKNSSFQLVYVPVTAAKLAEKIQPSEEELRAYFDQHKTEYRILESQKKVRYLFIDQAKAGEKLQISDDDLRAAYDSLAPDKKQAGVRVQQIVFKVARPDLDPQVRAKAETLLTQLRGASGGSPVTEEAFATAAKGNSEDPATAKGGGWLPVPFKRDPNKANELYDRMMDMQEGEMSDVVKFGTNYYILRRGPSVPKTFEAAKPELLASQRNSRAYAVAAQLAARAETRLKETKDFQKVAQELAAEANMAPAQMVKETPYIKPGDDVPEIGSNQKFEEAIAPLENPNDVGVRTGVRNGFAIPMLLDKREPRIPEYEEVRDKIAQALKQERAKSQLEQRANELATSAASAGDLKTAAEKMGLEAKTEEAYKIGAPLGEAGTGPAADDAIYALKEGEVTRPAVRIGDNWVVIGAIKRTEADLAEFAKQRDQLMQTALSALRNQVFDDYITAVQARMQREGRITINKEVLAKVSEDEPAAAPPRRAPRIPGQQ
ncbi:MAG TPA: SurA N-terminal domain-containing protein [Pyrinomonadaceae bacterium]|jgi:peptidyl-prolyl cis-trans isomerase D|nr:SurA N-terminal domain-containing protein [Pyrinomonadaceae bacterium]